MKDLSTPIDTQAAANQSGWGELYDIYLNSTISTPWGNTNVLRLTTVPGGVSFFTPTLAPEPAGTRGDAQAYQFWPIKREPWMSAAKINEQALTFKASNVTTEWAQMLADVDWYDSPVIIRKISTSIAAPTMDDCAVLFSGMVDSVTVSNRILQFSCSNDVSSLAVVRPSWRTHAICRFRWCDDLCTAIRFRAGNYKAITVDASSTTTKIISSDFSEDTGSRASYGTDLINATADGSFSASSAVAGQEAYRVKSTYTTAWWGWTWASGDWGTAVQGVWEIPAAQSGLKNAALKPYWQVNFGSAKTPRVWRISNVGGTRDFFPRLIEFFSSPNNSTWTFEGYFEMPSLSNVLCDVLLPGASSAQYWRICQRTRWSETNANCPFFKIYAYETSRNWWAHGVIRFADDTITTALQGMSAAVTESYSGEIWLAKALPVAPDANDTLIIERGCPRTFNGCAERDNVENYGGFDSLPFEQVNR